MANFFSGASSASAENFFSGSETLLVSLLYIPQYKTKPSASGFSGQTTVFDVSDNTFYEVSNSTWKPITIGVGNFDSLDDVDVSGAVDKQLISFDASTSTWRNVSSATLQKLSFDTTYSGVSATGELAWNIDEETLDLHVGDGVTVQLGQEMLYHVINKTGSDISNGTVCMFAGSDGASGKLQVQPAVADGSVPSKYIMGIATETIPNDAEGYVTAFGKVRGINTSVWSSGSILYADPGTPGGLTATPPVAPNAIVTIAAAVNSKANGTLFVRTTFGSSLFEDDSVRLVSLSDGDILTYNSSLGIWENEPPPSLGYLPLTGGTVTGNLEVTGNLDLTGSSSVLRINQFGSPIPALDWSTTASRLVIQSIGGLSLSTVSDPVVTKLGTDYAIWHAQNFDPSTKADIGHTHTEADITDLQAYLLDITGEALSDLADVSAAAPAVDDVLSWNGTSWIAAAASGGGGTATYGSNANGEYVRFPSGVQICWHAMTPNYGDTDGLVDGVAWVGDTWTFPASFDSTSYILTGTKHIGVETPAWVSPDVKSLASATYVVATSSLAFGEDSVGDTLLLAIGTWS